MAIGDEQDKDLGGDLIFDLARGNNLARKGLISREEHKRLGREGAEGARDREEEVAG